MLLKPQSHQLPPNNMGGLLLILDLENVFIQGRISQGQSVASQMSESVLLQKVVRDSMFRKKWIMPDPKLIENTAFITLHSQKKIFTSTYMHFIVTRLFTYGT